MATKKTATGKVAKKATATGKAAPRKRTAQDVPVTEGTEELTEDERASLDNAASNANLM